MQHFQGLQRQRRAPRSFSKKSALVLRILHPGCHVPDVRCCFCLSIRRTHDHSDPNSSDSAKNKPFRIEQFRLAENNTSARPKDGVNKNAPTTCGSVGIRGDRREINIYIYIYIYIYTSPNSFPGCVALLACLGPGPDFLWCLVRNVVFWGNPSTASRILHPGFAMPLSKRHFFFDIRRRHRGCKTLVVVFPRESDVFFPISADNMEDAGPWSSSSLGKVTFSFQYPSTASRMLDPGRRLP